jgi:DNA transposition AAA+ family ATPase
MFEHAHKGALVLGYGGAGVGKTSAAARYAKEHWEFDNKAFHINLHCVQTPTAMLHAIADAINAPGRFGAYRNLSMRQVIADTLSSRNLLILDEAQSLRPDALDMVRYFLDECGTGICLLGNELVFSSIAGKNRRALFAQLHSRVGMRLHLPHSTEADADAVLASWGVTGGTGRDYGRQIALGPGGLRQLCQVLRHARIAAAATKQALDQRLMYAAANALGLAD